MELQTIVNVFCEIEQQVNVRPSHCVEIALVKSVAVFGKYLFGEVGELILVTKNLNTTRYLGLSDMSLLFFLGETGSS